MIQRAGFLAPFLVAPFFLAPGLLAPGVFAQGAGAYFNVESPQRKPITTARVAGHDFLVVCNTPDSCVEIYDTHPPVASNTPVFLTRVQTGAEPVSVVYNATLGKLFTCNFLGDSISVIALTWTTPSGPFVATLERTTVVGDEPNHIAFGPNNQSLFVTLGSQSAIAQLLTADLKPFAPGTERFDLVDTLTGTPAKALEDPCVALVASNRLFVLGHRGGKIIPSTPFPAGPFPPYDFDVWSVNIKPSGRLGTTVVPITGLGTSNFSMAFAENGDLWTVGTDAQIEKHGLAAVTSTTSGFVRSKVWRIAGAAGGSPQSPEVRDLNLDATETQVGSANTIGQPTDLALYQPAGPVTKVYVAGFNRDTVDVLIANPAVPLKNWTIVPRGIPTAPGSTNPSAGPRGLAIKYGSGLSGDPGAVVYVLNRLDNSVSVIRVSDDTVLVTFPLQRDPTPAYIRAGRQFLYSARFSGDGIVSCASCHIDGKSDFLNWNLSDNSTQPVPPLLLDGVNNVPPGSDFNPDDPFFPPDKGWIMTQSLQGMVNFETGPDWERAQSYFTNEPLHWRGDRGTFVDFQGAFAALLEASASPPAALLPPPDLVQMEAFRKYVFSIVYPPNPEQPPTRTFSGNFVDSSESTGDGAQRGMKLFHMRRLANGFDAGRSCVECHWLPEGSNNRITLFAGNFDVSEVGRQPLESAATRLLRQKERYLVKDGVEVFPFVRTGMFGLLHQGTSNSLRSFIESTFPRLQGEPANVNLDPAEAFLVASFVREIDTGVGPLVGQSLSINTTNNDIGDPDFNAITLPWLNLREAQAGLANHGLAVQAVIAGTKRGFWFDQTVAPPAAPVYREEPSGLAFSRAALLALVSQSSDLLVVHVTALGNERRVAWQGNGSPPALTGFAPTNVTLETAIVGTAYKQVPELDENWVAGTLADDFDWTGTVPTPPSLKTVRIFQYGLVQQAPQFGLTSLHHDAPRRFRVSMNGGRHGAKLVFKMGVDAANPPPGSTQFVTFELALHPTNQTSVSGRRIWETAAEAEPRTIYMLMLGGSIAPGVEDVLEGNFPTEPPPGPPNGFFYGTEGPTVWNQFLVSVRNEDTTLSSATWQALKIE